MNICTIQVDSLLQDHRIILSSSLKNELIEQNCTVKFGQKQVKAFVLFKHKHSAEIIISKKLADDLRLPENQTKLQLYVNKQEAALILGPILMIWTDVPLKDLSSPFFNFCKEVVLEGQIKGIFPFIKVKDQSKGFFWSKGCWQETAILPEPDVIYNRIHSRKFEKTSTFSSIKSQWKNAIIFNDHFLDKWITYELLFTDAEIRKFLPQTYLLNLDNLVSILSDYEKAYLKPIHGSQGKGIYLIDRNDLINNFWVYSSDSTVMEPILLKNLDQLSRFIERIQKRKFFIVQQAIPLSTLDGQLVDFRFLLHYYDESWHITSSVARVGETDRIISNQAQGGQLFKPLQVLKQWFPSEAKRKLEEMKALSIKAADTVLTLSDGLYCELGMDLAVDNDGTIWILEVNSKPSKSFPLREELQIRPSARAICKTCLSLFQKQIEAK
ncbi:YheC/D-like protein [Bacillus oleivorans]|uniref:YheC/D-like protein n=1 Tax=Bacillus oleivorans TaxID=1448271 RepID=A0A285CR74_9BACI|nr:YheC/YheD family protein [Bacillus oleivorans]SNX69994.1 YheC/D-like protein [Bacillus oleivorans]